MGIVWSEKEMESLAQRIKAMGSPIRLSIICLLAEGEMPVQQICRELGSTQPNISQHLSVLFNQGLLQSRKEANWVYYSIADQQLKTVLEMVREIYCH